VTVSQKLTVSWKCYY